MTKQIVRAGDPDLVEEVEALRAALEIMRARVADLERLADTDTLTPLPNRRAFLRELDRTLNMVSRHNEKAAVLFVDLNGLKTINDSHGHQAGDAVILHVARELRAHVRLSDVVARIGGDEFAIILHRVGKRAAEAKAQALAQHLSETLVDIGRAELHIGIGCGVAEFQADYTVETVLARADSAMYAKRRAQRSER
jgi:diguanylate cyclase (GGDEF)-like protein